MTDTQYLINLAPDFSVLKLAEKYLYCDSVAKWDSGMIVDKLFFAIKKSTEGGSTYNIPFKRVLLKTESGSGLSFSNNYVWREIKCKSGSNYYIIISDTNNIEYKTSNYGLDIVGVGF